ncbi:hypothetical protein GMLC_01420 [Geomonas limicola]|uniref:BioF2-like acetyltransferase domain-containing protein n=1 Tax=Geomonas limicola TaxID=2740186 RepID=A0A6V8N4M2_9BACT|nr:FemAB family XrtA/PEP-CTERM system-associated protein [Geomonas limicola]GFO66563.1 hypothetical protein GMLC_01420 [Geomonas limicola]
MTVRVIQDLDPASWDAFVQAHPEATSYHLCAWRRVIEESFGHCGHYLAALDGAGQVAGVLPLVHMKSRLFGNFLVSMPFMNYGGLLLANQEAQVPLLEAADRLRRDLGADYVELRHLDFEVPGLATRRHKVTMMLRLATDVESQWAALHFKLRNHIRKAQKNGLTAVFGGVELLDGFYDVFAHNMRDLGTPVYARSFFHNVLTTLPESTRLFAVRHQGMIIAAGLVSRHRDTLEIPWSSSLVQYRPLCANNLLYWEAISWAISEGCSYFDFGRSTPDEGTFNFKKQWGAVPVPLAWQYLMPKDARLPDLGPKSPKYQAAIRVWKRLPVRITRILGPAIVRNIP